MNRTVKKLAALFLALAMALTMLPAAALAAGGGDGADGADAQPRAAFSGTMHILTGPPDALTESPDMTNGSNGTMQGSSFGVRFRLPGAEAGQPGDIVANTSVVCPAGDGNFTFSAASDATGDYISVMVSGTAQPGDYTLTFTVDGAAATLEVNVSENSTEPGGSEPGGSGAPVVKYRRQSEMSPFQPVPTDGSVLTIEKDEVVFLCVMQGETMLDVEASLLPDKPGQVTLTTMDGKVVQLTGGDANGQVAVKLVFEGGDRTVSLNVTGNTSASDTPSDYVNAQVRQVPEGSTGSVAFDGVSAGAGDTLEEGFALSGTTLTFDPSGRPAGLYTAVVGGKTYAVAVMKALSGTDAPATTVTMSGYEPAPFSVSPAPGAYACLSGDMENISAADSQLIFQSAGQGVYDPIYIYLVENSTGGTARIANVGQMSTIFGTAQDVSDCFEAQVVELQGAKVLKLTVRENVPASATLNGYVNVYDEAGNFVQTAEFAFVGAKADTFGFTADPALAGGDNQGALRPIDQRFTVGSGPDTIALYLTKGTGDNGYGRPARYDLALYDDIDISALTVTSSNNAFVAVKEYLSATPDGKNAIGFALEVKDDTRAQMAEITVSFEDKSGTPHIYKGVVRCAAAQASETETVKTVEEFLQKYNFMTSGTIVMEAGTYSMDLVHDRYITIRAAEGARVIINGSEDGTGPIITIGLTNPGTISGVIIDGRGKRDGIAANGNNCYAYDITVQNCQKGVIGSPGSWALLASGSTFRGNKIAIQGSCGRLVVENCLFEENTIAAISIDQSTYTECRVQMNRFVENASDISTGNGYDGVTATQNYWQHGGAATKPRISTNPDRPGKVYYSPWFANSEMTLYTADLEGARPGSARAAEYTVPVDRTLSSVSLLDSALFAEMKGQEAAVSIPVTEKVEDKALITTIWEFDSGKLASSLPEQMDLEVTDAPTDAAKAVVDAVVENPEAIAQYVNFSHSGTLPGEATVLVRKTGSMSADDLKLYYIDTAGGTVKPADIVAVSEATVDGVDYYVVTVAHCSEYLIAGAITLKEETGEGGGSTGEGGSTGGNTGGPAGSTGGDAPAATPAPTVPAAPAATATPAPDAAPGSANQLVSALEVEERFETAAGSEAAFDVARKPLVSTGAFGILARNPEKALVLEGEGYAWRFEGAAVTDPAAVEGASFDTTVSLASPNAHLIEPLLQGIPAVNVYFSYHGALPGPAQITLQLDAAQAGTVKYVYWFDPTAVVLEYVGEATVDASGVATFTIEHCSDYVLLDEKLDEADAAPQASAAPEATPAPETTPAPEAQPAGALPGGTGFLLAAVAVAAVLAAVILLLVRRRRGE